ncbi:MAG TPA: CHAD domain-containing protein [Anaerolineae bacterium]|nr:CHAD domain-containing protein [Anaerolineae bacterium]
MNRLALLHPEHLAILKEYLNSAEAADRRKANILLAFMSGSNARKIAEDVELSVSRVYYWRREYLKHGLDIFLDENIGQTFKNEECRQPTLDEDETSVGDDRQLWTVKDLQQDYHSDVNSANFVSEIALRLFDDTISMHGLGEEKRKLLRTAAELYNLLGLSEQGSNPNRSADVVLARNIDGFNDLEQLYLSALIRVQRGKINQDMIAMLTPQLQTQKELLTLILLLRLAIRMDTSHSQSTIIDEVVCAPHEIVITVHGPFADQDTKSTLKEGKNWRKYLNLHLEIFCPESEGITEITKGEGIPYPKPMDKPGIQPWNTMAEAGRKILRYHFAEMLRHEDGTRFGEDIEELHDMRVATRRMRAAFIVFSDAFEPKEIKSYIKGLRGVGRALGKVRDLDVFMEKATKYLNELPSEKRNGLDPLLDSWHQQRDVSRMQMIEYLDSENYKRFKIQFNVFVNTPGMGVKQRNQEDNLLGLVQNSAPMLIYTQFSSVRSYEEVMQNATLEQLHALRIRFKKFRYTVEFFREVLGDSAKEVIRDIKMIQDHLGDLNDANVACALLNEFIEKWEDSQNSLPLTERVNPEPIVAYLASKHAERYRLMTTFPEAWAYFTRPEFKQNLALAVSVL